MLEEFFENISIIDIQRTGASEMSIMFGHNNEETEYELHIESMARITKGNRIILSQLDSWSLPEVEDKEGLKVMYDIILRDEIQPLLPLKVLKAAFSKIGDVELLLENDMRISSFNNDSDNSEQWRIFDNAADKQYVFKNYEIHTAAINREFDDMFD